MEKMTPTEVSQLLALSLATVYRQMKSGIIPSIKTPEGLRVESAHILKIIARPRELTGSREGEMALKQRTIWTKRTSEKGKRNV